MAEQSNVDYVYDTTHSWSDNFLPIFLSGLVVDRFNTCIMVLSLERNH